MVASSDLTLDQVRTRCQDPSVARYIETMPPLPATMSFCRFLTVLMQSSAITQSDINAMNKNAITGEFLDTYPSMAPNSKNQTLKDANGNAVCDIRFYELKVLISANKRDILPVYR